jgi:hypothetical protein
MRLTPRLPAGWGEQRKLLGFCLRTKSAFCKIPRARIGFACDRFEFAWR